MKKIVIILGFMLTTYSLISQSIIDNTKHYYYEGVPQYWTDDSTSVNIIVKNMQNYNAKY